MKTYMKAAELAGYRQVVSGPTRLLLQVAIEYDLPVEVVLWNGLVLRQISEEWHERLRKRVNLLYITPLLQWGEREWHEYGFVLEKITQLDPVQRVYRTHTIPLLFKESRSLARAGNTE